MTMKKHSQIFKPISQEHSMGCAVACVASLCAMKYQQALKLFKKKEHAWTRGFYCGEIVNALEANDLLYVYAKYESRKHARQIQEAGTIVFVAPCTKFPAGHFLLRTEDGWMNPWSNYPLMKPVESAIENKLPGPVSYLVFPNQSVLNVEALEAQ
jgi:hypothetical protein